MACKKLRAIFLCHYRVPDADFTRFFLPKSHDPVTLSLQFSCEGFSSRQWRVSIKIDKTARFMALGWSFIGVWIWITTTSTFEQKSRVTQAISDAVVRRMSLLVRCYLQNKHMKNCLFERRVPHRQMDQIILSGVKVIDLLVYASGSHFDVEMRFGRQQRFC